ncbi:MAG TPA: ABC transporter ATP-binding protein [Sporichthyaceae bacterium]|nr:ABC transporter ATP-binding protein [Sporichthyaceae bacterium]
MLVLASVLHTGVKLGLPVAAGNAVNGLLGSHGRASGPWVPLAIALLTAEAVIQAAIAWAGTVSGAETTARTRHLMLRHAIAVGPGLTRRLPAADLVSRLTGNAALSGSTSVKVIGVLRTGLPAVAAAVIMYWIDLWCAAVFTAGLILLVFLLAGLMRTTAGINARYLDAQTRIATTLAEVLGGVRTVAAAGTAPVERRRILTPVPELHANGQQLWQTQSVTSARVTALMPMLSILVAGIAGCRLTEGRLSVGAMFEVFGYASLGSELVGALAGAAALGQCRAGRARCAQVLAEPATAYGRAEAPAGTGAVTFVDVWLGQGPEAVLRGVDVRILGGEHVAVVGRSGAGKSAFAALIGRLAEPDRGVVCLDGRPVEELSAAALHGAIAYAFTRPALLGATVADTIALGAGRGGPVGVSQAARAARAETFIARLPNGYDTALAQAPMSGGEAQRLGLARAFAHPGRVLVLDDATSSLDTVTEHQVAQALACATRRTRVVVAHRASTAARADRVLWLDDGRVRADGTHRSLWNNPGYRALFDDAGQSGGPCG